MNMSLLWTSQVLLSFTIEIPVLLKVIDFLTFLQISSSDCSEFALSKALSSVSSIKISGGRFIELSD